MTMLVHLGLDKVELKGEGFTAFVAKGDHVEAGQPVSTYDVPAIVAAGAIRSFPSSSWTRSRRTSLLTT